MNKRTTEGNGMTSYGMTSWMIVITSDAIRDNGEMTTIEHHLKCENLQTAVEKAALLVHGIDVRYGHIVDIHIERD
jgi:hypothetical protein